MGTAMRAKKLVILLAVLLVVGLGLFGWFRPREVVLPENCRLRVTIDSFSDDRIFVDDPEKKAQLLELSVGAPRPAVFQTARKRLSRPA